MLFRAQHRIIAAGTAPRANRQRMVVRGINENVSISAIIYNIENRINQVKIFRCWVADGKCHFSLSALNDVLVGVPQNRFVVDKSFEFFRINNNHKLSLVKSFLKRVSWPNVVPFRFSKD